MRGLRFRIGGALTVLGCAWMAPAHAHVTLAPAEVVAGSFVEARFTVPHGCEGAATVAVRVRMPEGVTAVKPQAKSGWRVEIKRRKLTQPVAAEHGRTIDSMVEEVDWIGGPLGDDLYDDFGLRLRVPDTAGKMLYFPVVQECEKGIARWIDIPAAGQRPGDLRTPAPAMSLTARP